jgi:hypothetical protein
MGWKRTEGRRNMGRMIGKDEEDGLGGDRI